MPDSTNYSVLECLGSGSFGVVYKVKNNLTNEIYAMKVPKSNHFLFKSENSQNTLTNKTQASKAVAYLNNEINALKHIPSHSSIIHLVNYEYDMYFLIPYYEITLLDAYRNNFITNNNSFFVKTFNKQYIRRNIANIFMKLLSVLEHIHKNNYTYKDMKPENILIDKGRLILIDFGGSSPVKNNKNDKNDDKKNPHKQIIGTLRYCSINCHKMKQTTFLDDIENLIYMCIWLYEGTLPWVKLKNSDLTENNTNLSKTSTSKTQRMKTLSYLILESKLMYKNEILNTNSTTLTTNPFLAKVYKFICVEQAKHENISKIFNNSVIKYNSKIYKNIREIQNIETLKENNELNKQKSIFTRMKTILRMLLCYIC